MMYNHPRQILLRGGPLEGVVHELYGNIIPAVLEFPVNGKTARYYIENGVGYYKKGESNEVRC